MMVKIKFNEYFPKGIPKDIRKLLKKRNKTIMKEYQKKLEDEEKAYLKRQRSAQIRDTFLKKLLKKIGMEKELEELKKLKNLE